jgi:hypothetical protein
MSAVTKDWLLRIADAVQNWHVMPKDSVEVAMAVETPDAAMRYSASTILDARERAAVEAALPRIATEDFAEAARQIRAIADTLTEQVRVAAAVFSTLGKRPGTWFCVPCLTRLAGLTVPDHQYRIQNLLRSPDMGRYAEFETSDDAACGHSECMGGGEALPKARATPS